MFQLPAALSNALYLLAGYDATRVLNWGLGRFATLHSPAGLKANLFAKDFKKQVLAADALKAWVSSSPEEVSHRELVL